MPGESNSTSKVISKVRMKDYLTSFMMLGILFFLILIFSFTAKGFFSVRNLYNLLQFISITGIITIAQTFVIVTAGIDLSQGSIIGLTGTLTSMMIVYAGMPIWLAVILGMLVGLAVGVINGWLVAYVKLPPFIATLGTMIAIKGVALLCNGGNNIYNLPPAISKFGVGGFFKILPYIACILIVLAIIFHIILSKTRFGRYTYAIGSNEQSAALSGIKVSRHLFKVYALAGLLSGLAGIIMLCRVNSGVALAGEGYQMDAIAASVIGGGSLFGGEGSIFGSMVGALIMTILSNGLQLLGVSSYWQNVVLGVVVVLAVYFDNFRRRNQR